MRTKLAKETQCTLNGIEDSDKWKNKIECLFNCTFAPASWDNRFVRSIHARSEKQSVLVLTEKQKEWIDKLIYKYRRQIKVMSGGTE